MLRIFTVAALATFHVRWTGRGERAGQAESLVSVSDGATGKGNMRLRSGKNDLRCRSVLPRFR